MQYHIHEGSFDAPDDITDRSVNVLVAPGDAGVSVVVSRDRLQSGEGLEGFMKRQLADLARQVSKFQEITRKTVWLGPQSQNVQGIDIATQFKQQGQTIYQRQSAFVLPDGKRVLILTHSSPSAISEAQHKSWDALVAGFRLR